MSSHAAPRLDWGVVAAWLGLIAANLVIWGLVAWVVGDLLR